MDDTTPIYSSRITKIYLGYLEKYYPHVDIDAVLEYAGMTRYEVEDPAHRFNQRQVDRFHRIVVEKTGNPHIARDAGRYAAISGAAGALKQYALGLVNIRSVYQLMGRLLGNMTHGTTFEVKRLASNKVEITSTPRPGVNEKPYQCENRRGTFESIPKLFTESLAKVEHPACWHKGADCCRYIVSWENVPSMAWKRIRNYALLISVPVVVVSFFFLPFCAWGVVSASGLFLSLSLALGYEYQRNRELTKTIGIQGDAARSHLEEIDARYNNAMLVQEIGDVSARVRDIRDLLPAVSDIMKRRLPFDRGAILLAGDEKKRLRHAAGYGYSPQEEEILRRTVFNLDNPGSSGLFVVSFREQRPFLVDDVSRIEKDLSKRSREFARRLGSKSLICVPIVFEGSPLGILVVDNNRSERPFTRTDVGLLSGIASQLAVSLVNVKSLQKLQESEERYRTVLEQNPDPVVVSDIKGRVIYFNPAFERIFGWSLEEYAGRKMDHFVPEENRAETREMIEKIRMGESFATHETRRFTRDGRIIDVSMSASVWHDRDGRPKGSVITLRDISDRKRLERRLHHAQKMESIGTIASGVAHNFRNILAGIMLNGQLIKMKYGRDKGLQRIADRVCDSVEKGARLVDGLMQFSRKEATAGFGLLNLSDVLQETYHLVSRSFDKRIDIRMDVPDIIPVRGDAAALSRVMMSLCTNARDAMPDGGKLRIDVRKHRDRVEIAFSDTGHGIEPEMLGRCFDPFFTTKEVGKGTGLGLSTAYGIVRDHGGNIQVRSRPGKGSVFTVSLPLVSDEIRPRGPSPEIRKGRGEVILVVDDEREVAATMETVLGQLGYQAVSAGSGDEAVAIYEQMRPDVVLMDRNMPGMDGLSCAALLVRKDPEAKIILISGYDEEGPDGISTSDRELIRGYLAKPVDVSELSRLLSGLFSAGAEENPGAGAVSSGSASAK